MRSLRLTLTDEERQAIEEAIDDPAIELKIHYRLMAVRMHDLNISHGKTAAALNMSANSVTNHLKQYQAEGLSGLTENRYHKPVGSVALFFEEISRSLAGEPVASTAEAAERIEGISGVRLSDPQARRVMVKLGLKYLKTAPVPGKADPRLQFIFLEEELLPRLEEAREGKRRVFSADASHFVLGTFPGMI